MEIEGPGFKLVRFLVHPGASEMKSSLQIKVVQRQRFWLTGFVHNMAGGWNAADGGKIEVGTQWLA